jgi:superfamily II DNA or RNA helicase
MANGSDRKTTPLSHRVRPQGMSTEEWQRALRVQAGEKADFRLKNLEDHPVFSSFSVTNPQSRSYRVAIRGEQAGLNYCSCRDFATNRLGVCKHIAFTLHRLRSRPATARALARGGWSPPYSEVAVAYDGPPRLRLLLGSEAPQALRRLAARRGRPERTLRSATVIDARTVTALASTADQLGHELRVYDDARHLMAREADDASRVRRLRLRFPDCASDAGLELLVNGIQLHRYQREGAWFLAERGRAILADDMGLGKTVQAIAAARLLMEAGIAQRVLLICPASLCGQWSEELGRLAAIAALTVRGPVERRRTQWSDPDSGWKVATYDVLHRDVECINAWGPDLVIFDEAQRVKNWQTLAAQAARRLAAPLRMLLSGTPIENKLDELHALVELVDPHLLGPLPAFKEAHSVREAGSSKVVAYQDLDRIAETLKPILLRRNRSAVMTELPGRTVNVMHSRLSAAQREVHDESQTQLARLVHAWRRRGFLTEQEQLKLHKLLLRMRMVCDDHFLIDQTRRAGSKLGQIATILDQELARPEVKIVIFSAWMDMHALIRERLEEDGVGFAFLHGGVPSPQRQGLIRRFRDDASCRVFLSTDCGATGLNLQCASALINVDLPWNPAVREQRIGRIHRQGQRRPVRIYDLIAEDGIEAGIAQLLRFKADLAAGILDGGPARVEIGSSSLDRVMRSVEEVERTLRSTATQPSPTDVAAASVGVAPGDPVRSAQIAGAAASGSSLPPAGFAAILQQGAQILGDLGRLAAQMRLETDGAGGVRLNIPLSDHGTLSRLQKGLDLLRSALGGGGPSAPPFGMAPPSPESGRPR